MLRETVQDNPYQTQSPTIRQLVFLEQIGIEALFGGAAGGGKSSALLMAALQFVQDSSYNALLLRRSFADLEKPDSLIPRSHDFLAGTDAVWRGSTRSWRFPSGATLSFGYLDNEADVYQYQSAAFQFIGFDELTQFTEFQYRYLFSRLRQPANQGVPLRVRAATNPGGVGHQWVKERFILGDDPDRVFIPSKLDDNPHLDTGSYRQSLSQLDQVTRRQLEHGDWDASAGTLFKRHWFSLVDIAPAQAQVVRYWDLAATPKRADNDPDWTAGALVSRTPDGLYTVLDVKRVRASPREVEQLVRATAEQDGRAVPVYMEQEPGSSGVHVIDHYQRYVLDGWYFRPVKSDSNKTIRAQPLSAAAEAGNVRFLRGHWCGDVLSEFEVFPNGSHDDAVDAISGAHLCLSAYQGAIRNADGIKIGAQVKGQVPNAARFTPRKWNC
jgi:predicted phage terminase large subunit-like protein